MTHLLCSTGAFSRDPDVTDPRHIIDIAPTIDCDGIELIFYPAWYEQFDEVVDQFARHKNLWMSLHTEKSIGPLLGSSAVEDRQLAFDRLNLNCQLAAHLGIQRLVLHLWGLPTSDRSIETNISQLDKCMQISSMYGLELSIETVPCLESTPLTHIRRIISLFPETSVTLDTEFLAMHGELEEALADPQVRSATRHIHVKDFDGVMSNSDGSRRYLHPGEGNINLAIVVAECLRFPKNPAICLESTSVRGDGSVDLAQVSADVDFVRALCYRAPYILREGTVTPQSP